MKSFYPVFTIGFIGVTLHVRVWIEISGTVCMAATHFVTLRVRVWIEVMRHH